MPGRPCPSEEELCGFAAEVCDETEAADIRSHVEVCEACKAWLDDARANDALLPEFLDAIASDADSDIAVLSAVEPVPSVQGKGPLPPAESAIPGYEFIKEIGHGEQGVVHEARQLSTQRTVAVKILRRNLATSTSARGRFEREIELVASMKHPNIVTIHDSGVTQDGRPYCVMDHVRGLPLHRYVRENKLALEETLKLFRTVCEAVNYAHQRGVMHRDLKPSNILVDDEGEPRVLDFGLAKSVVEDDGAFSTLVGQVGTPAYMAPEQTHTDSSDVDVRADVYALGVVLYELLTGEYPYPVNAALHEIFDHIRETPAVPPRRRWGSDTGLPSTSRFGACPIDDEVETITLCALAKERHRRYQGAGEFGRDIARYLANEPIEAKRESGFYRLKKTVSRYRVALSIVGILLAAGIFVLISVSRARNELARTLRFTSQIFPLVTDPLAEAETDSLVEAVSQLDHLISDQYPEQRRIKDSRDAVAAGFDALQKNLEAALTSNRIEEVARTILQNGQMFTRVIRRLDNEYGGRDIERRLQDRLAAMVLIPPPQARSRLTLDCVRALNTVWPQPKWVELEDRLHRLSEGVPVVWPPVGPHDESYDWRDDWFSETGRPDLVERDSVSGCLHIMSDISTDHTVAVSIPEPARDSDVVVAGFTLKVFSPTDSPPGEQNRGGFSFSSDGDDLPIFRCDFQNDSWGVWRSAVDDTRRFVPLLSLSGSDEHTVEIRYFRKRATFDFIVDGEWVVEEEPCHCPGGLAVGEVRIEVGKGAELQLRQAVVRAGDFPLKRDLGRFLPITTYSQVELVPGCRVRGMIHGTVISRPGPLGAGQIVFTDDDDAQATLHCLAMSQGCTRPKTTGVPLPESWVGSVYIQGNDVVGGLLAFGEAVQSDGGTQSIIATLEAGVAPTPRLVDEAAYAGSPGWATHTPIRYAPGETGFVVGGGGRPDDRRLLWYDVASRNDRSSYQPRLVSEAVDASTRGHDIRSLAACDVDRDGADDLLFLGLGHWGSGYRPMMVPLHGGTPQPARPLTVETGITRVAIWDSGNHGMHLIAVSEDTPELVESSRHCGIRLWNTQGLSSARDGSSIPAPDWTLSPMDVKAVATGRLDDRDVFATASIECTAAGDVKHLVLRLYGLGEDGPERLWESVFFGTPPVHPTGLWLRDVDDDGRAELIVNTNSRELGLLVYSRAS